MLDFGALAVAGCLPLLYSISLAIKLGLTNTTPHFKDTLNQVSSEETSLLTGRNQPVSYATSSSSTSIVEVCHNKRLRFFTKLELFLSGIGIPLAYLTSSGSYQAFVFYFIELTFWLGYYLFIIWHPWSPYFRSHFIGLNRGYWLSAPVMLITGCFIVHDASSQLWGLHLFVLFTQTIVLSFIGAIDLYNTFFSGSAESSSAFLSYSDCPCFIFEYSSSRSRFSQEDKDPSNHFDGIQNIGHKLRQIAPYLWPENSIKLKLLIIFSLLLMLLGRVVNWLVPQQYGSMVRALGGDTLQPPTQIPYVEVFTFIALRFLQGSIGLISNLQQFSWIPVCQFTTRALSVGMLKHLHSLSIRFHLNRRTGEILRVQDRGVASIVSVLNTILFSIIPTIADITIAAITLCVKADLYIGLVVLVSTSTYIAITIKLTDWRTKYRRECNKLDNEMEAKAVDSLLNFETVKYFGAEDFEVEQYATSVDRYMKADVQSKVASSALNTMQNTIIQLSVLTCCLLAAHKVVNRDMSLSGFIEVVTYVNQLYAPLNWFGGYYRTIQKNFVDMEKMLALFKIQPEITDNPYAKPGSITKGEVEFDGVSFAYDSRTPILKNISFRVPAGSTVALVGPSGGGKSTILRLLFRFYDVNRGRILIDGRDIRDIKQSDLRQAIGVVPQDTVLFNDDVEYNIRYGKIDSQMEELKTAAQAAQIHDRIESFPDGYQTRVGERGLRLSGGEKQRIAIARTFLKDPPIVLLDEATSALDTATERQIQGALGSMTQNRTTLIIAHRLSTVVDADLILVLRDGEVVERGSHKELMGKSSGVYYDMWQKQLKDTDRELLESAMTRPGTQHLGITRLLDHDHSDNADSDIDEDDGRQSPISASCPAYFRSKSRGSTLKHNRFY